MDQNYLDYFGIPPRQLCKYLPPERIDVLENLRVRFTPMLETNDRFEIRRTFEIGLGAKANQHFDLAFAEIDVGEIARQMAAQTGQDPSLLDYEFIRELGKKIAKEHIVPAFNKPENVEAFLLRIGGRSCALSLTDDPFNASMWDRYASRWTGFVLYFDTASDFFQEDERGRTIKPEKVSYRDDYDAELVTNVRGPLLTKLPVWSNEREWRVIIDADNFGPQEAAESQHAADLKLRKVPALAFVKILLGPESSDDLVAKCMALKTSSLPHLEIYRARPDRFTGQVIEEPVPK